MEIRPPLLASDRQRKTFASYVTQVGDCLMWTGAKTKKASGAGGYAIYSLQRHTIVLHRQLWKDYRGPLDDDQKLDHSCRNRSCLNLDHMEPVTQQENVLRGHGITAQEAGRTHCPQNHPYDDENTYINPAGARVCRECTRQRHRAWSRAQRRK